MCENKDTRMIEAQAPQQLLTADEVAELLQFTTYHVYRLAREGKLAAVKFNERTVRFDPADVQDYINVHRTSATV